MPNPTWWRQGGHLTEGDDERARDKILYSFTHANQNRNIIFGLDTTTPAGREAFKREYESYCEMMPEIVKKEDLVFPHEIPAHLSTEPHFQRVWQHYREHMFRLRFAQLVEAQEISEQDAQTFSRWVGLTEHPTFNIYIMGRTGLLDHLAGDEGYQATMRVMDNMGLGAVKFDRNTAMPMEE